MSVPVMMCLFVCRATARSQVGHSNMLRRIMPDVKSHTWSCPLVIESPEIHVNARYNPHGIMQRSEDTDVS